jgi:serine protease Do
MSRRFALVTVLLVAASSFLVGVMVATSLEWRPPAASRDAAAPAATPVAARLALGPPALVNFADVVERVNAAVVNIDATSVDDEEAESQSGFVHPWDSRKHGAESPRHGTASGFLVEPDGYILTNDHVVEHAERIIVKVADGRTLRARLVGADPDTDVALIKVDSDQPFRVAPLGDSDSLRVGEWVCAIGNPLAYEHTVTVGVVSYIGRKLWNNSLDNYIQTDAAINFGNSGGPLINSRGEVIGINSAVSSRAASIGFAVPVNQARAVIPQLKQFGRVARGYIGVVIRDVDPDIRESLNLTAAHGALVQDLFPGSPAEQAGLKAYDLITALDGKAISTNDELIRLVSAKAPGTTVRLDLVRDGRPIVVPVKLTERPSRGVDTDAEAPAKPSTNREPVDGPLGVAVRDIDRDDITRLRLPRTLHGVLIARVEPLGPGFDASLERGQVIVEVNRRPVATAADFDRLVAAAHAGDVLTLYLYLPDVDQHLLRTVRIDRP